MTRSSQWRILGCLLALVLASSLAGVLMGRRMARAEQRRQDNPETWNESALRTFDRTVRPTPEQRQKIQAHLARAVTELKAVRADTLARSTNIIWQLVGQVEQELTPEQRQAFEQMKPKPSELTTLDVLQVEPPPR